MSARGQKLPTLYGLAAEELERAGGDRTTAVDALVHRPLDDEVLRRDLVAPIIRNICAGTVSTVVRNRRGAR